MILKNRLFVIFLLSIFFSNAKSQNILEQIVSKDYSGYLITDVFLDMEQQFGIKFFYKQSWIDEVSVPKLPTNQTLKDFIETTLSKNGLSFIEIQGVNIILIPSGYSRISDQNNLPLIKTIGNPLEKGKYALNKIEGHIRFGSTSDPAPGAVVINKKHNQQTSSDKNGYYSMNVPGGISNMEFSFSGMETYSIEVDVYSNGTLDCELYDSPIQLEAVNITAYSGKNNIERTQIGLTHIDMKSLSKLPALMGEVDIVKGMSLLPGVQTTSELSSGFNVRGGSADQNQILIDGAPIYNTSHLFGLFSTLIPEAISNVEFHKGTQSANYGGRLSSVMNIQLKKPDNKKITGRVSTGFYSSGVFLEGPIKKDFCTFSIGARTTYANWMLKKVDDIDIMQSETNFYDLIGNLHFNLNAKNKLKFFGYYSSDYFKYSDKNIYAYGSLIGGLNYQLIFNDLLFMSVNIAYTDYKNDLSSIEHPYLASTVKTGINQLLSKVEFNLQLPQQNILFGVEGSNYYLNSGVKEKYGDLSSIIPEALDTEKALELAGFIHDDISITKNLSLMIGMRYSWYSKYGESQSYVYEPNRSLSDYKVIDTIFYSDHEMIKPYAGFEPRLGLRYKINKNSSIKAGYHVARQYQHLISNSSIPTPSDYWKSADLNIKPMTSQQFSLGYFKNFLNNSIETSVEGYYRELTNVIGYRNGAVLSMNTSIERDLLPGFSKAYGLEFMVKKNTGMWKGWLSYTLSKTLLKIDSDVPEDRVNNGNYFPSYNDRPHDLSIAVNYQFTRRWNFACNFLLSSGLPATFPEKKYKYRNAEVVYFSERNKYSLPANHRLDLALTYEGYLKKTKKVHPSFTFSIYNVYGHKNVYSSYFKNEIPSAANDYNVYGVYKLSVIGAPIPTITVNLRF